ncbi:MAG: outer membrane beta-barrel protein [Acidobacteriota bacterium]
MQKKCVVWLGMLILSVPLNLWAEDRFGFEIGGFGGGAIWRERTFEIGPPQVPAGTPHIPLEFSYNNQAVYGARFNFLSRGIWGGEVSYGIQNNTLALTRQGLAPLELKGNIHQFFYNTIFYPFRYEGSNVQPFVTGGIGLANYRIDGESRRQPLAPPGLDSSDRRFAFNYGFGVKAKLNSLIGVRADFRHNFSDVPSFGLPKESSNPAQLVLPIQGKLQNFEASAGIYLHFSWKPD